VKDRVLSFEDLIIDVLVFPDGQHYVLDEDELPESLDRFENGFVNKALVDLQNSIDDLLPKQICETMKLYIMRV
jgi:predicted RNA-binding protein associated with RNAse of E/G family